MERQTDVDERADGLHTQLVLCMVEEISLATLVCWMPIKDIKLGASRGTWNRVRTVRRVAAFCKSPTSCLNGWIACGKVCCESR